MSDPSIAIITAAMSRYRADTPLQGLMTGATSPLWNIFSEGGVPTNLPFPFVVVELVAMTLGTAFVMGTDGRDVYLQTTVFTQTGASGGFAQARGIIARVDYLTQTKPFDLTSSGLSQFLLLYESEMKKMQEDGITQMLARRFKLMTQG